MLSKAILITSVIRAIGAVLVHRGDETGTLVIVQIVVCVTIGHCYCVTRLMDG